MLEIPTKEVIWLIMRLEVAATCKILVFRYVIAQGIEIINLTSHAIQFLPTITNVRSEMLEPSLVPMR